MVLAADHQPQPWRGGSWYLLVRSRGVPGLCIFLSRRYPLAAAVIDAAYGRVFVHLNLSQLGPVLMMLREEKPIYLYEFGADNAGLMTGSEPTGEEEGLGG